MQDDQKTKDQLIDELTELPRTGSEEEQISLSPRYSKPGVPDSLLSRWQAMTNLMGTLCVVPAVLIMKVHSSEIEVFISAKVDGNPYRSGEKASLNTGLYCEHVMSARNKLLVPNALADPNWDHNPDISLGMISYLGYPLQWPDGDVFGTICILDNRENCYSVDIEEHVQLFRDIIESHLALLFESYQRRKAEEALSISEECYRNFFETSRDCVFITALDGKVIDVNEAGMETLGFSPDDKQEMLQKSVISFYANPEDRETHAKLVAEKGFSKDYPVDLRKKDGTIC